jgi:hypothetical protein
MKRTAASLLLVVAAVAGWWWYRRRQAPATVTPEGLTIPPNGDTSLPALSQVGSNVYQDVTGDLLDRILASYERIAGGCWTFTGECWGTPRHCQYRNSVTGQVQLFPSATPPLPLCGGSGAAAP